MFCEDRKITVREVTDGAEKQYITRLVLEALPEWFEVAVTREAYIRESADLPLFAAYVGERPGRTRRNCMSWGY